MQNAGLDFITQDHHDPWIKDQSEKAMLSTIFPCSCAILWHARATNHSAHVTKCHNFRGKIVHTHYIYHILNSVWPSDTIWWERSGSTLAQVIAWCLMAPSQYLNQCWVPITEVLLHSTEINFTVSAPANVLYNELENHNLKIVAMSTMS